MNPELRAAAQRWCNEDPDPETRDELRALLDAHDEAAIRDRFGSMLEFGTAGLRGVLGAGPNRMNRAMVMRATAGLCAYLRETVPDAATRGVVVGYDGRRKSAVFARDAAEVIAGSGLKAWLFDDLGPTPLTAFAVLNLGAAAGVMVTASHNPPEYNGYKVYAGHGGQIVPPEDDAIAKEIRAIGVLAEIARLPIERGKHRGLVRSVPATVERAYLEGVRATALHRGERAPLKVAYTALHGVGNRLAMQALAEFGEIHSVSEQAQPDGNFPTVAFPNPEEKGAMDLVLALARRESADLVLANDPDADRLAVAVPSGEGFAQLSGNDVGVLLGHYLLTEGGPREGALVATTIVSSPLLARIAANLGVRCVETLTGFKWIVHRAMELERTEGLRFVFGYEEALGYCPGSLVRDKDGISAACVVADFCAWAKARGETLPQRLEAIQREHGLYASAQRSVTLKGAEGSAAIAGIMEKYRRETPAAIDGRRVTLATDFAKGTPPSNALRFDLEDGSRVMLRPSGTEPKIKYYFDQRGEVGAGEDFAVAKRRTDDRLRALVEAFLPATT